MYNTFNPLSIKRPNIKTVFGNNEINMYNTKGEKKKLNS